MTYSFSTFRTKMQILRLGTAHQNRKNKLWRTRKYICYNNHSNSSKLKWIGKTEYLKKEYKLKKKLTLKCYNLTKYGIDLSLEINKLKEGTKNWKRIMETGLDRSRRNMWKGQTKRRMWLTIMHKLRYVYLNSVYMYYDAV